MNRRHFLKLIPLAAAGLSLAPAAQPFIEREQRYGIVRRITCLDGKVLTIRSFFHEWVLFLGCKEWGGFVRDTAWFHQFEDVHADILAELPEGRWMEHGSIIRHKDRTWEIERRFELGDWNELIYGLPVSKNAARCAFEIYPLVIYQ